jgi:DNA-binding NarL/FixJ family response regulator
MSAGEPSVDNEREPIRIVLADDQRLVRESLGTLLSLLSGIELVASAADGEEALALSEQHKPDVVLMDLRMPRLDGIEATRELHKDTLTSASSHSPPTRTTRACSARSAPVRAAT